MEGSDSSSRWDSSNFEKFITLFALTMADHLLVNIWTTVFLNTKNKGSWKVQCIIVRSIKGCLRAEHKVMEYREN